MGNIHNKEFVAYLFHIMLERIYLGTRLKKWEYLLNIIRFTLHIGESIRELWDVIFTPFSRIIAPLYSSSRMHPLCLNQVNISPPQSTCSPTTPQCQAAQNFAIKSD